MRVVLFAASCFVTGAALVACGSSSSNPNPSTGGSSGGSSSSGGNGSSGGMTGSSGSSSGGTTTSSSGSSSGGMPSSGGSTSGGASGSDAGGSGSGGTTVTADGGGTILGHPGTGPYPTYPGFALALVEEFDAPIDLDNDPIWTWSDGGLSEGNVRFLQSQITFQGGNMVITAANQSAPSSMSYAENMTIPTKPLSSGEFRTKYNDFRYGRYEARFKPPTSNGNFISTMFLFRTPKNLFWREIDVELTANNPNMLGTNVYRQDNGSGSYDATYADVGSDMLPGGITNDQADFHIYAIEWMPTYVKWYVDGQLTRTKDATHGNNMDVMIPEKSTKIMMNLWIFNGTGFGGAGTNTYPLVATYDWFRFYKADVETTYPCTPTPTCLSHDDMIRSKNNPDDGVMYNAN